MQSNKQLKKIEGESYPLVSSFAWLCPCVQVQSCTSGYSLVQDRTVKSPAIQSRLDGAGVGLHCVMVVFPYNTHFLTQSEYYLFVWNEISGRWRLKAATEALLGEQTDDFYSKGMGFVSLASLGVGRL